MGKTRSVRGGCSQWCTRHHCGADIQDSGRIVAQVAGWGINRERLGLGGCRLSGENSHVKDGSNADLITLGSDSIKDSVVTRLQTLEPGPAYWHYPKSESGGPALNYDEEYFKGLCSERRVANFKNGQQFYAWTKLAHASNEPFDVACYSFAALEFLGGETL
jgi:Phage terminase large subunit (GpA)